MSLGAKQFSYYSDKDGIERGESNIDFSPEVFLKIMRQIA